MSSGAAQVRAQRRYYERNVDARRADARQYQAERYAAGHRYKADPAKISARNAVHYALRTGKLQREPCLFCGSEKVYAHHHDYSLPLAVTWLCTTHHGLAHRKPLKEID